MQAVILAGGFGVRLKPMTDKVAKPMIPIGRRPYLDYQLSLLKVNGFLRILLLVGYLGQQIKDYFGDGRRLGLEIKYSFERQLLGTAGALKLAENLLENEFFLLFGDSYLPIDYKKVQAGFKQRGKTGLMVVYDNQDPTGVKNNVALDDEFNVAKYKKGKQPDPELKYVEAGVSVFKKQVLKFIAPGEDLSLEEAVFPGLIKEKQLSAFVCKQRFYDIGTPEGLARIKEVLK